MTTTMLAINTTTERVGMGTPYLSDLHVLQNERFFMNLTQMLNISADNLTSLLQGIGTQNLLDTQPQPTMGTHMGLLATLSVGYALIFVAGVLGNLITCIVISRNNFMHTATNFYLFNLAISDLILLCSGMPQDLYNLWHPANYPFSEGICILESVLSETAANATVLTITSFTVERYIAICHPFRQHTMSKLSRAIKFIFAIWIAALLLALPQAIQFSVVMQDTAVGPGSACTMKNDFFAHVFAVSGFIFFGGPMTAICVLYVLIGIKLKRSRLLQALPRRSYDVNVNRGISAQTRVIRMLVAVAVAFFICWAPFHAQRLMAVYGSTAGIESEWFNDIFNILNYTSGVLYFLSTCINPLLYNIMSHKFREAFKVTLARHFGLSAKSQGHGLPHTYSALRRNPTGSMRLHTDSVRTTTTMTTLNGSSNGNAGAGSRGSQRTLLSTQSRSRLDMLATRAAAAECSMATATAPPHRVLQTQISQLSSVGDAHSLLEVEQQQQWPEDQYELGMRHKSLSQAGMAAIDELSCQSSVLPSRSRLKLTRIRRQSEQESSASSDATSGKVRKAKAKTLALKGLRSKLHWRGKPRVCGVAATAAAAAADSVNVADDDDHKPQSSATGIAKEKGVY